MSKKWVLTQQSFDELLAWLDPDREQAGRRYEEIRRRLIKILTCRGCLESEDLADETINRVAKKLADIRDIFEGNRALYFYGVANKVHLEYLRRVRAPLPELPEPHPEGIEQEYECLEHCMQHLPDGQRELVLQYYQEEKGEKIVARRRLAERLGIGLNALRIRAFRIRASLQECVQDCLRQQAA
jgi:DNA-directed RNA polymerase specialized sigma24 family protein